MNFKLFLTGMLAVLCWIIIGNYLPLLYYWFALVVLVSILNRRSAYKKYASLAHVFFLAYICYITWIRTRHYKFSGTGEFWLNNSEHILFAIVVCLIASLYVRVIVLPAASFGKTLLLAVVSFNLIGVFNEYFQNVINHRELLVLIEDSKKDLLMNLLGTLVFTAIAYLYHVNKSRFQGASQVQSL